MALFLVAAKQPRAALIWCAAIVLCAATMGALKLGLAACGRPLASVGLTSPSGHAAMSAAVYGGFGVVIATTHTRWLRRAARLIALVLVIGIALSRLILHRHTALEVAIGLAVGCSALLVVVVGIRRRPPRDLAFLWLLAAAAIVAAVFHGERWPAEQAIHHLAGRFDLLHAWCVRGA
jgi:membrane-associated phospholipid phosphatase